MARRSLLLLLFVALLPASCSIAEDDYSYCSVKGLLPGSSVELDLTMKSGATYNLFICATIETKLLPDANESLPLLLKFVSPSGRRFADTLSLPAGAVGEGIYSRTIDGVKNIEWHYLSNVVNRETGRWRIFVEPYGSCPIATRITGVGMRTERCN